MRCRAFDRSAASERAVIAGTGRRGGRSAVTAVLEAGRGAGAADGDRAEREDQPDEDEHAGHETLRRSTHDTSAGSGDDAPWSSGTSFKMLRLIARPLPSRQGTRHARQAGSRAIPRISLRPCVRPLFRHRGRLRPTRHSRRSGSSTTCGRSRSTLRTISLVRHGPPSASRTGRSRATKWSRSGWSCRPGRRRSARRGASRWGAGRGGRTWRGGCG